MDVLEYEELKENYGIGSNDEDATFELKLEYSVICDIKFRLFKEKSTNDLILVIIQTNGDNFIFKSSSLNEIRMTVNKIILNLEHCQVMQSNTNINLRNGPDRNCISLLNGIGTTERDNGDSISGILIGSVKELEIGGESLHEQETLISSLLDKITTNEGAIDFSLMDYSLITQGELFKSLLENTSVYTSDEMMFINQHKRGDGPQLYISKLLRNEKIYYHDNFYLEVIRNFEELFCKAPRLKKDIILYRGGAGNNRANESGRINLYDGLVSFSIEKSVGEHFASKYHGYSVYKMKLPKGTPCLCLFCLDGLEGNFINEVEVLMPSFLYQVESKEYNKETTWTEYNISYIGKVSMIELLYERLKRAMQIPKFKSIIASEDVICNSPDNLQDYISKGFDPSVISDCEQLDIMDAIKYLYDKDLIAEINMGLYKIFCDELNNTFEKSDFFHTQRVYFIAMLLAELDGLTVEERRLLTAVVKYHDIGRESDCEEDRIGKKSADKLRVNIDRLKEFTEEEQELILFVIEQHSNSISQNEEALLKLPYEKRTKYGKILSYFKDADLLDSSRLETNKMIDINSLKLPTSLKLIFLSYELDKYYVNIFDYMRELDVQNSKLPDMNKAIKLIEETGYKRTQPELMELTKRILDGESISSQDDQITVNSILKVTQGISITEAKDYLKGLFRKLGRAFKRWRRNG